MPHLCKKVAEMKDGQPSEWLMALPLYHFLSSLSKPYEMVHTSVNVEMDNKLGITHVKKKADQMERLE